MDSDLRDQVAIWASDDPIEATGLLDARDDRAEGPSRVASLSTPKYSVVVPMLNEQESVLELGRRLGTVLDALDGPSEVILIDDGSTDATYPAMLELRRLDARYKVIRFSRNFGHQMAITAGLDVARGEAVILMDGDRQHPPEMLPQLIASWREGHEIVYAVQAGRDGQGVVKKATAALFYRLLRRLTPVTAPPGAGDFRLIDRRAVDAFKAMHEGNRFVRGMWDWIGFDQIGVPYVAPTRYAGRSKYSLRKMFALGVDAILSFSNLPLRAALSLGLVVSGCSFAYGLYALALRLAGEPSVVPGWASIVTVTSFVLGVQLVVLGVLGEYIGRIYDEVKGRPNYIVRASHGLSDDLTGNH